MELCCDYTKSRAQRGFSAILRLRDVSAPRGWNRSGPPACPCCKKLLPCPISAGAAALACIPSVRRSREPKSGHFALTATPHHSRPEATFIKRARPFATVGKVQAQC